MSNTTAKTADYTPEYIARIQLLYPDLFEAEKRLADFFLNRNWNEPFQGSVKELARSVDVSVASVVRFCQKLGYEGYAEFKLMMKDVGFLPSVGNITLDASITAADLKKQICDFTSIAVQRCADTLDNDNLQLAIDLIRNAKQLTICGVGTTSGIAVSAANTFMNLNIPCISLTDDLQMLRFVSCADPETVVLAYTPCGYVKPIVDVLATARKTGKKTILITENKDSLAAKYADSVLQTNMEWNPGVLEMLATSAAQLLVTQILQAGCLMRGDRAMMKRISSNRALIELTRYSEKVTSVKEQRVRFLS